MFIGNKVLWILYLGLLMTWRIDGGLLAQGLAVRESKALIDTALLGTSGVPDSWPNVRRPNLSPRGGWVAYKVSDHIGSRGGHLVVQDREGKWQREYNGVGWCMFSGDDRQMLFQLGDSLHWVGLAGNGTDRVLPVRSFRYPAQGDGEWVAYQEKGGAEEVVLVNLLSGKEQRLGKASEYVFSPGGKCLLLEGKGGSDSSNQEELRWVDLVQGGMRRIWVGHPGEQAGGIVLDGSEQQGAFVVRRKSGDQMQQEIWYYRPMQEKAELRIREGDSRLVTGATFNGRMQFSSNGRWLFLGLQPGRPAAASKPLRDVVKVDVWSYRDRFVQPDQLIREETIAAEPVAAAIGVDGEGCRVLASREERLETWGGDVTGEEVVVSEPDTAVWSSLGGAFSYPRAYHLVSLVDGRRRLFGRDAVGLYNFQFSPDGRWLFYYDTGKKQYYSYDVQAGVLHCLTQGLPTRFSSAYLADGYPAAASPAGWWKGEERVLLYDRHDLWGLDPGGRRPAINITRGYGARHGLQLRLLEDGMNQGQPPRDYGTGDSLVLTGFGEMSKDNGFVRQMLGATREPEVLTMGPYLYYQTSSQKPDGNAFDHGMAPVKAVRANCWVVKRQTASEAPNYFITTDWVHYRQLSDVRPQARYRWLTAELVNYHQLDGRPGQGILYKPEDFDAKKKYPMIIHYYEQLTHRLHEFPLPGYTEGDLNIPWFVSRGYLVFTPDIHYEYGSSSGRPVGQWACNAVVAGANYLATLPYVDSHRIGLQGHSFGGLETNYLVTHSHLFAAACEFSGPTDMVSLYLTLEIGRASEDHWELQSFMELGQEMMGATLWQRPELYLDQSAVLRADRVTTPLLLVHNKKDGIVSWRQGVEWYLALRRLRKRAWMLQYDDGDHSNLGKEAMDFTERLTQFFGYYLKGEPPPRWMTEGIAARLKGKETGLAKDTSGRTP